MGRGCLERGLGLCLDHGHLSHLALNRTLGSAQRCRGAPDRGALVSTGREEHGAVRRIDDHGAFKAVGKNEAVSDDDRQQD